MEMAGIGNLRRTAGYDKKRLTGYNPARRYLVCSAVSLHGIVHLLVHRSPLPGTGFFWQVNSCRIMSKPSVLHGGSLLKPPRVVILIGAWRTAALKCISKPPPGENVNCAHKATCPATVFSFPVRRGRIVEIFSLIFSLCRLLAK